MNHNYRRGYNLERKVKMKLEEHGFIVIRSGASKSNVDLMAAKDGKAYSIQVKLRSSLKRLYDIIERGDMIETPTMCICLLEDWLTKKPLTVKQLDKDLPLTKLFDGCEYLMFAAPYKPIAVAWRKVQ